MKYVQIETIKSIQIKTLMFLFAITFCIAQNQETKPILNKVEISGDSLVRLYVDGTTNFRSSLDSTKTSIKVILQNTFLNNSVNNIQNTSIFKQIQSLRTKTDVIVNIQLYEKRGYTTFASPISNQILVNIVDWKNLTKSDDYFHTALLAIEDSVNEAAKKYLNNAILLGNSKAAAVSALLAFKNGEINRAFKFSEFGVLSATYLPDLLILRANILKAKGDTFHFKQLADEYKKITGDNLFLIKMPKSMPSSDTLALAEINLIDSLTKVYNVTQTETTEPELKKFDKIFSNNDSLKKSKKESQKDFWGLLPFWLQAVLISVAAFVILLLIFYLRWRNLQVKANISKTRQSVIEAGRQKQTKKTKYPQAAVSKYQEAEKNTEATKPNEQTKTTSAKQQKEVEIKENDINPFNEEKVRQVEEVIEAIKSAKREQTEEINQQEQDKIHKKTIPARIEIARSIAEEQKKIKQEKLSEIDDTLYSKSEKLKTIAKKIGIEENTIEMKNAISKISKDKNSIDILSSKFIKD